MIMGCSLKSFLSLFLIFILSGFIYSCFDGSEDTRLVGYSSEPEEETEAVLEIGEEAIIVTYANVASDKLVAYSSMDGSVIAEAEIDFDRSASALAVYKNRIYIACRNNDSKFYTFSFDGESFHKLFETDIASWADSVYDNPNSILIANDTGYISLMGQAGSSDGSVVEFNPADYTFTKEIVINEDAVNNDNPTSLYHYNNRLYCAVYTMDTYWVNQGSYIYNVTDEVKVSDLTITNAQYAAGYKNYLYCSGKDQLEVYDLEEDTSSVIAVSGAGEIFIAGTTGFLAGGYDSSWTLVDRIWTFDPIRGAGELTEFCDDWGGSAILGTSIDSSRLYATVPSYSGDNGNEIRENPFGEMDAIIQAEDTFLGTAAIDTIVPVNIIIR